MQGGGGLVNGIKLPNGRIIKKVGQVEKTVGSRISGLIDKK